MNDISIGDLIAQFKDPTAKPPPSVKGPDGEELSEAQKWFHQFQKWLAGSYEETVHHERSPGLHASGLGKVCGRRNLLIAGFGVPPTQNTAGNYFTYDVGHALHFWWQERYLGPKQELWGDWMCVACPCPNCKGEKSYKQDGQRLRCDACRATGRKITRGLMPMNCECGVPWQDAVRYMELPVVNEELDYVGHTDGILDHKPKRRIFEFKTISPSEYKKLDEGPKYDHVVQAHAYMEPLGLDEALIVYEHKGSQAQWSVDSFGRFVAGEPKVIPFIVQFDATVWDPIVERIKDHHRSVEILNEVRSKGKDKRPPRKLLTVLPRVCSDKKCDMAQRCPVSRECFSLDAPV